MMAAALTAYRTFEPDGLRQPERNVDERLSFMAEELRIEIGEANQGICCH